MTAAEWCYIAGGTIKEHKRGGAVSILRVETLIRLGEEWRDCGYISCPYELNLLQELKELNQLMRKE